MKRLLAVAVVATLAAGTPALAAKKPAKPKPVKMTYYLHGSQQVGELDQNTATGGVLPMNATKPSGTTVKQKYIANYVGGPNTECASNTLFAFWEGNLAGTLTGAYTITLFTTAAPGSTLRVRLFNTPGALACNEAYPAAVLDKQVTVPQGEGKVTITGTFSKAKEIKGVLQMQLSTSGTLGDPSQIIARYDATTANASIAFSCLPRKGKKSCA